ncbi:hypothetical protein DAEQUDRAFT_770436 [Daedalea quercina L-15889]|uniref:Uncharacterized protein n=1 Tax=Daedalea quercina L-15889 TaxID=1314783 RepID=A0A165KVC3_9APHY|nr:hypothetical protein DAEQUDRAFT_770436 [Daedalea quercina L-15889]
MAHFGRPLFGGMYDAGNDDILRDIIAYAGNKLICAPADPEHPSVAQSLACIGVRMSTDFRPCIPAAEDTELTLVAEHLRLLLYAGPGFSGVLTACASEPLLAEASYELLIRRRWPRVPYPPCATISKRSGLDLGTRGATVAAALLLDARDRATTFPLAENESPDSDRGRDDLRFDGVAKRRIVTVP